MTRLRFRVQWRQRWGSLLALTLLIGVVGATVLATVAGARRTRSVVERTDNELKIPDAFALIQSDSFAEADAVLASPVVGSGDRVATFAAFPEQGYLPILASVDGHLGTDLHFDQLVAGRRPDPSSPVEVAIPESVAHDFGVGVGGRIRFHAPTPEQSRCFDSEEAADNAACAEVNALFETGPPDWGKLGGPTFDLEVVGITRQIDDVDSRSEDLQLVFLTKGFFDKYQDTIGYKPAVVVRFAPGVTDQDFEAALGEVIGSEALLDFNYSSTTFDSLDATVGTLANGLLIFGAVAAIAGLVAITQALARQASAAAADARVLAALGTTRAGRVADLLAPLVPVALGGATVAVVGAGFVSPFMPIGTARDLELADGFDFDGAVLVGGGMLLAGLVLATGVAAAVWVGRTRRGVRRSGFSARVPASVPVGLGVRWALHPGRADGAVPVRSAISGVALGVAGIVAVAGFAQGLERLTHDPARTGWGWDLAINGNRVGEPGDDDPNGQGGEGDHEKAARILEDPDVEGVALAWIGLRTPVNGRSVSGWAIRQYEGDVGFVVVDGRAPAAPDEVALGAKTMQQADVGIGGEVMVGERRMDVVGQAIFPDTGDGFALADGALLTEDAVDALRLANVGDQSYRNFAVDLRDGADRTAALERLAELNDGDPPETSVQPGEVRQLSQLDDLPGYLAVFLFVVAVLAVAHALVITVRRRRRDLGVVRSLGATRRQSSRTITWQATTIALVGVAIGLPCGLVLGRYVWARVAQGYGVADDPAWPVLAVVLAIPVTVLVANAIAWWPGRRAARIRPSEALRAE